MTVYAGVDLGATTVRAVVGDADGTILGKRRRQTPRGDTGGAVTEAVLATLDAACEAAGTDAIDLAGVGIGAIGPLDADAGAVVDPANLPGIERIDLRDPVAGHIGGDRVRLLNDAVAGVVGERRALEDRPETLVYLTLSTGIGAGVCVDGHVLVGRGGNAAEVGHFTLDPTGAMTCGCGAPGHWEAYCSGANLPDYARHRQAETGLVTDLPMDERLSAADIFAAEDDPLAADVLDRVGRWNALGVATLDAAYAPEVIAVGGTVALENPDAILDPIHDRLPAHVVGAVPTVRLTTVGASVVVRGALASVLPDENLDLA